jgi:uncharacterized protein YecE (DUF72 family)
LYLDAASNLKEKLGTIFLQMHNNFESKNWDRVVRFVEYWPKELDLAIEFKHTDWFNNPSVSNELMGLLKEYNIPSVLVDMAGRRDLMHIRLTNNEPFIRYVGSNHESDYKLLNDWVKRLKQWKENRLRNIHFFVHQNLELESPLLAAYFIDLINQKLNCSIKVPQTLGGTTSNKLF